MAMVCLLVSFLLYGNTLPNAFVYDDYQFVDSPAFHDIVNLHKWFLVPGSPSVPVSGYRPLTYMTMNLQLSLVGDHPLTFHLVNMFLNAAGIFLVFVVTNTLFSHTRLAIIVALLFAFFPIHTESVASIKSRDDLLAAVLALLAWLLLLRGKQWWSGLVYVLAVFAKELVLFVPLVYFLVPRPISRWSVPLRRRVSLCVPYIVGGGVYATFRFIAFGEYAFAPIAVTPLFNPLGFADGVTKFWTNWKIVGMYITKTFIPYNLSAGYQYNHLPIISSPFWSWEAWVGILSTGLLLLFFLYPRTRRTPLGIGTMTFVAFFIPIPKVVFQAADIFAERWMYGPSIGLAMVAGYLFDQFFFKKLPAPYGHYLGYSLLTGLLVAYAAVIIPRNRVWSSQYALFTSMVHSAPNNVHGYYSLAHEYYKDGDLYTAKQLSLKGLAIQDTYPEMLFLLGKIAYHEGQYAEAEGYFYAATHLVGHATQVHGMYALMLAKQEKYQQAIDYIGNNLDKIDQNDWTILLILGASHSQLGDTEKAKHYLGWDSTRQDFVHRTELDNFLRGAGEDLEDYPIQNITNI